MCDWGGQPCFPLWDTLLPPQSSFHQTGGFECRIGRLAREPPALSPCHFLKTTVEKFDTVAISLSLKIM